MTSPSAHADGRLFEPVAGLLARFVSLGLPTPAELSTLIAEIAPDAVSGAGRPIRFVPPPADAPAYEMHIHASGEVPTRPGDWHDFFNALAWCVWPRTKSACNALHLREQRARAEAGLPGRGPLRDALTQFDECGIVVVSSDPQIPALLADHAWEEAFWARRAQLLATTRFLIFGHGSWDQLRQPFIGLCAKAIHRVVDAAWLSLPAEEGQRECDAWLAARLTAEPFGKADLTPLPLLGVPGVVAGSESADYYRDIRQFRPRRAAGRGLAHAGL